MSEAGGKTYADYVLPPSVVTKLDVAHMVSDAERVENELTTAEVRAKAGAAAPLQPRLSETLADFLALNKLTMPDAHARAELIKQLRLLKDSVPIIHMTFAVEADPESLQQLATWLRETIHPQAVIAVGLQPALVAGVYLRTPNRAHDLSLRAKLEGTHDLLVKELEALRG